MMRWFDAHLDLAYMHALGRDMHAQPEDAGGADLPAGVTLPSLAEGHVSGCLATIFVESGGSDPRASYAVGDAQMAHARGVEQLNTYHAWAREGEITLGSGSDGGPGASPGLRPGLRQPMRVGILIEGADVIRTPSELQWWKDQGVVAVGMAWWRASRYAGGNGSDPNDPAAGISPIGRELVKEVDRLSLIHDASHLSDRALDDLFAITPERIIASHSNCRAIMGDPSNQRHLTDVQIREIVRRDGVIGLNLYSKFLRPGLMTPEDGRATIDDCVKHIEHICTIAGDRLHVGLGSDMDGGFSAARLPEGMNRPRDLIKLAEGLRSKGWNDVDVERFAWSNWQRVLRLEQR